MSYIPSKCELDEIYMTGEILVLHEANPTYIKRFVGFSITCGYSAVGAPSV
jgi:hypothetical protein